MQTTGTNEFQFEHGPNSILDTKPLTRKFLTELELDVKTKLAELGYETQEKIANLNADTQVLIANLNKQAARYAQDSAERAGIIDFIGTVIAMAIA